MDENAERDMMPDYQSVFKRVEMKYIISREQMEMIEQTISEHMILDKYGPTEIRNIYYDTDTFLLARLSIDRPIYKEKLRIRSYGIPDIDSQIFIEIKKKYKGIVYKRRVSTTLGDLRINGLNYASPGSNQQIIDEIAAMTSRYEGLKPKMFIMYRRKAYRMKDNTEFRLTFDEDINFRVNNLNLEYIDSCKTLLPNQILMEIKTSTAVPLWLARLLSDNSIFKTNYSKYGNAYASMSDNKEYEIID